MRPKTLEIQGLQSFRDIQRIDFDRLGQTGLFGIFGPTGSGKSTILDAITFAMYGKVSRAERGTQGIINSNLNDVKVSFVFEILKDGSRKAYKVERAYRRKKGSLNSCEPRIARLIEITDAGEYPLCDKATEVSGRIEELLGLNHDDFTRAVVLPQNRFQEFLMLDNSKKRDMLERIFYLEEYGKNLTEKVNKKIMIIKSRLKEMDAALSMVRDASDEALEEAKKAMDSALLERTKAEKGFEELEVRFNEAKDVWHMVRELEDIKQKEQHHIAIKGALDENRIKLEKAQKAEGLLSMIKKTRELSEKLSGISKHLNEVSEKMPAVDGNLNETRVKSNKLKEESEAEKPKLVEYKTRLRDALDIRKEISGLDKRITTLFVESKRIKEDIGVKNKEIFKAADEFNIAQQIINSLKSQLVHLRVVPEYRSKVQECAALEGQVKNLKSTVMNYGNKDVELNRLIIEQKKELNCVLEQIGKHKEALENLNKERQNLEDSKPEDRNTVMKYRDEYHRLENIINILKLNKLETDNIQSKISQLQNVLSEKKETLKSIVEEKEKAERILKESELKLKETVNALNKNTAYKLSKTLKEGKPCPVCGSEAHPNPAVLLDGMEAESLEQQLEEREKRFDDASEAFKENENIYLITTEQLKNINKQITLQSKELEQKKARLGKNRESLPEALRGLSLNEIYSELSKISQSCEEKLKAIEIWEKDMEELKDKIGKSNERLSDCRLKENSINAQLILNIENKEQIEKDLEETNNTYKERQNEYGDFLRNLKISSGSEELKHIWEKDNKSSQLEKRIEEKQNLVEKKRSAIEQLKESLVLLDKESAKIEGDRQNCIDMKKQKALKVKELAGEVNIEDEITRTDKRIDYYSNQEKQYEEELKRLEKKYNELDSKIKTWERDKKIYEEYLLKEEENLQAAVVEKGFNDGEEVEIFILSKEKQKYLSMEINDYDNKAQEIKAQMGMVLGKLKSRSITEDKWNKVSSEYQNKKAFKEACVSHHEVTKSRYTHIKERHGKWIHLTDAYKRLSHRHGLLEEIQKLLRAEKGKDNSFVDYIAEERLRYVAAKASETLGLVTKYKYALELDTNAGFIIRDNMNGGTHRMVNSLSGGETFLTSLSLALALSEQIQLKGQSPLEFFFLDEGFGTLDNDLLDGVIDSLERLSRKERVIGLITHVPEIRSRIARRLIVEPPSLQGDGSRVRIEKA